MDKQPRALAVPALLFIALVFPACSQGKLPPPEARTDDQEVRQARPLELGGAGGHAGAAAGDAATGGVAGGVGPLTWTVPDGWVEEAPRNSMRQAQYRVPGSAGDAECVVFYFGPGQGGDVQANIARWANQFLQPDGASSLDRVEVRELEGGTLPLWIAQITGTYNGGMTMTDQPSPEQPNSMLLGGIAQGPQAPWFFKFVGPEATVRQNETAFLRLMESIRAGG